MVLLDYPNKTAPNKVYLMQENNPDPLYESVYQEENLKLANFIDAYLAYSPAGEVKGQLVYVNYGSKQDFELLADDSSEYYTNVTGKICITRYGQIFRGNKAKNAEDAGKLLKYFLFQICAYKNMILSLCLLIQDFFFFFCLMAI